MKINQQITFFVFVFRSICAHICIIKNHYNQKQPMNLTDSTKTVRRWQLLGLLLALCFFGNDLIAQNAQLWEKTYGTASSEEIQAIVSKPNGDYLMAGFIQTNGGTFQAYLIRTDVDGDLIYQKDFGQPVKTEFAYDMALTTQGVILAGEERENLNAQADVLLIHVNEKGDEIWSKTYGTAGREVARSVITTSDGGFLVAGEVENAANADMFLLKLDAAGDSVWMKTYDNDPENDRATDVVEKLDGSGYVVVGNSGNSSADLFLVETDLNGDELNRNVENYPGSVDAQAIITTADGYVVAGTYTEFGSRGFISKISFSLSANDIAFYGMGVSQGFFDVIEDSKGNYVAGGFIEEQFNAAFAQALFVEFESTNLDFVMDRKFGSQFQSEIIASLTKAAQTNEIAAAGQIIDIALIPDAWFLRTQESLYVPQKFIEGKVFIDANSNCQLDGNEAPHPNWIVTLEGDNESLYTTTDAEGNFEFRADQGDYILSVRSDNETWEPCFNDRDFSLSANVDSFELNFPIEPIYDCAYLEVDISAPIVTICQTTDFQITYCNKGTVDATDAKVEVQIDTLFTIGTTTLPIIQVVDNRYTFEVGQISAGDCGQFTISAALDCNQPILGQTHCLTANITPDSICTPAPQWNGGSITLDATCSDDSLRFIVKNEGSGDVQGRQALVIEDEILGRQEPVRDLPQGDSIIIAVPADGATYRLMVDQAEFHPGRSNPTLAIEGCVQTPTTFSTGFVTRFEEDEKDPFVSVECVENETQSTDLDFLRGYPKGIQDNLITAKTDLQYHIRFQNVGTDTLNRVVVRDTLSPHLDITSIRTGASSHPYTFKVYETGVIKFIFDDINLPSNTVSQKGSVGFIQFKIAQKPNNPVGTVIDNTVALSKDFNSIELTNSTRHRIGGDSITEFIVTDVGEVFFPGAEVKVFPNPVATQVTIEIKGVNFKEYEFQIFDVSGKTINQQTHNQNRFTVRRNDLHPGLYFYRVTGDGNLLNTGKLMVQ